MTKKPSAFAEILNEVRAEQVASLRAETKSAFAEILNEVRAEQAASLRAETKSALVTVLKESERRAGYIKTRKAELAELDAAKDALMKAYDANDAEKVSEVAANIYRFRNNGTTTGRIEKYGRGWVSRKFKVNSW